MTTISPSSPPRFLPEQPLPPYAYDPRRTPHPTRDPRGHSYGRDAQSLQPPDPENWRACRNYLYGIDLFNQGFYWEAHEAWEGLWVACGRTGPTATFLKALINLAAAGFKARLGNARGMKANAGTAVSLFKSFAGQCATPSTRSMGLDIRALADTANTISKSTQTTVTAARHGKSLPFNLVLMPK